MRGKDLGEGKRLRGSEEGGRGMWEVRREEERDCYSYCMRKLSVRLVLLNI